MKKSIPHRLAIAALAATLGTSVAAAQDPLEAHINAAVRPQDDFFEYANGAWFAANPIPPTEKENGIFKTIEDTVEAQVLRMCVGAAASENAPGSSRQKIGDFYASGMDSVGREARGLSELRGTVGALGAIDGLDQLVRQAAYVHLVSASPLFSFYVAQDDRQSARYALYIQQGGLTLPDRRYYVDTDAESAAARQKLTGYAAYVFSRIGYAATEAQEAAEAVVALETDLATHSRKREDLRDPVANYHKMSMKELLDVIPNFYFPAFTEALGIAAVDSVVVGQPEYLSRLNELLVHTPMKTWAAYLQFHFVNGLAAYADDALYAAHFELFSHTLRGVPQAPPRWKRVVRETNERLGDLIGQIYIRECLPAGTKEKFREIGEAVRAALAERISALDWMGDKTKAEALRKLAAVRMKLGWPDKWKDMSALSVTPSYLWNVMESNSWETRRNLQKLGKEVDRDEWDMEPQTYNAYYNPSNNEVCIPGCNILIPGFGGMPDDAVLYAIIGGTLGHEITHGFDDQGSQYDKDGNLRNWWTARDRKRFEERTARIVAQFDSYYVAPGLHINGSLTQGENIADLGGVLIALQAYKKTEQYRAGKPLGTFTPLQRFFLAYANAWMEQMRPEAVRTQVRSNEHAPAKWRVLGPLSNIDDFYTAFSLSPADRMYVSPAERVRIW